MSYITWDGRWNLTSMAGRVFKCVYLIKISSAHTHTHARIKLYSVRVCAADADIISIRLGSRLLCVRWPDKRNDFGTISECVCWQTMGSFFLHWPYKHYIHTHYNLSSSKRSDGPLHEETSAFFFHVSADSTGGSVCPSLFLGMKFSIFDSSRFSNVCNMHNMCCCYCSSFFFLRRSIRQKLYTRKISHRHPLLSFARRTHLN